MQTTLNQIKANHPCAEGYKKLLTFLGKTKADNKPLALSVILESNGLDDTIWCFRTVSGYEKELRLFAVFCARQIQYTADPRSINAIDVSEHYANGQATVEELKAAYYAAFSAARDANGSAAYFAARAAYSAAYYSAHDAFSAYYAARDAYSAAANTADPNIMPVLESYLKNLSEEK